MSKIKTIIRKMVLKAFKKVAGKRKWQKTFEGMYFASLRGMNIGGGGNYATSGEKHVLKIISDKLKNIDNIIIFDVGANLGHYSKMVNEVFGEKAKIFAFEPSKKTFSNMAENTNDLTNISRYNFGFGNSTMQTKLYTNSDCSGLASIYKRNLQHFDINMDQEEVIELRTIDDFCSENIGGAHIHFLKIDTEGHELKVLQGAKQKVESGDIDYIQFEFGGCNIDSRTYFQDFWYLLKDKYNFYRIVQDGLSEINTYKEIYECFITTNFLLEKKM